MKQNLKNAKRQLKVYEKILPRAYFQIVKVPEIRLCGKWLRDSGFECGQSVTIQLEENKITIIATEHLQTTD